MRALVAHGPKDIRLETREPDTLGEDEIAVRIARGGICGSDLHYYQHGGFGSVRLREPMILGHEVAGTVAHCGAKVRGFEVGQRVAVSPSRPCGQCEYCLRHQPNHCLHMRFYGSAMPFPHIQGAFRDTVIARPEQLAPADDITPAAAAMAEPLAVAIHAMQRAGGLIGRRVLITGCGPIGLLCLLAARASGAAEVVVTDLHDEPLALARTLGASRAINVAREPAAFDDYLANKGHFERMFECSGAAPALGAAVPVLRPGAVVVQVGLGGDATLPMQQMTAKEIELRGTFRFHEAFFTAVQWMRAGQIDVAPLLSHTLPLARAEEAFALAGDRRRAMKVQLDFA